MDLASGCGGVIKDMEDQWICGFSSKPQRMQPDIEEIMGILIGLHICWDRRFKTVIVTTDNLVAINLLQRGCHMNHSYLDDIEEAKRYLHREWTVILQYKEREVIRQADFLAKVSHTMLETFCISENPYLLTKRWWMMRKLGIIGQFCLSITW